MGWIGNPFTVSRSKGERVHRYIPTQKEVIAKVGEIVALTESIRVEYKWVEPGLYRKDRHSKMDKERIQSSEVSDPTGDVATGGEYDRRRNSVRRGDMALERARDLLREALGYIQGANPRYEVNEDIAEIPSAVVGPRYLKEQLEMQAKRVEMGVE